MTAVLDAIREGEIYPLQEFQRRTGLGKAAMRTLRQKGLVVKRFGKFGFVCADDFLAVLNKLNADAEA